MLFGKTDYSFERELSFVEWCNLFTFCNILYAYGRFGCPTFSLGRFRERLCQNGLGRKGEDGLRKISNIPWNGYCGGSNFQKQLERIRTILFRGDSNRLIDEQSHTQKNFKEDMYMYNNFSSKKTKKVISALLASALVVTSGPITAAAATNKVVGVKKSFTVTASATNKVTGLSKAEKKVVKVTKKGKKFTIKGLKAGKATFKIGKKAYTVKVGATAVKAAKAKVTLTAGKSAAVKFTATAGNGDTVAFKTSNKKVATLSKTSAKVSKNAAYVRVTAKAAGTAKVTATSKVTGKKAVVTVTVKAAATPATATPDVTATPVVTGGATATPDVTATPEVVSATAITGAAVGANKVQVAFNQPVAATGDAVTFTVTKGTAKPTITTVTWLDNKNAVLTLSDAITADTYNVAAKEKGGVELTTSFKGIVAVASKLAVKSTRVELDAAATVDISLQNNFGEEMNTTTGITATVYNVTKSKDVALADTTPYGTQGKLAIKTDDATVGTAVGDVLRITLTSGTLSVSETVTVVKDKVAENVSFGTLSLVNEKEDRVISVATDKSNEFYLPITVKDQYNDTYTFADDNFSGATATAGKVTLANGAIITSSDSSVIDLTKVTVDAKKGLVFTAEAGTGTNAGKEVTLTVTAPSTGKVATYVVKVYAERVASAITGFAKDSKLAAEKTLTAGDKVQVNYADFTYADQYGKAITTAPSTGLTVKDTKATKVDAAATTSDAQGAVVLSTGDTFDATNATVTDTVTTPLEAASYVHAVFGGTEKVTYKLGDSTLTTNFTVIDAVKAMVAKADKTTYTAGDEATVTLTAYKNATPTNGSAWQTSEINTSYNNSEYATVKVGDKKYTRNIEFKAGVATVKVPVVTAGTDVKITVTEIVNGVSIDELTVTKVAPAAFSTYEVSAASKNVTLTAKDAYGNTVETKAPTSKVVKVTAKTAAGKTVDLQGDGIDAEGTVLATVANGVITLTDVAKNTELAAGVIVTVVVDGVSYTGTVA